jgi:pimeloyl-ACP methyl ester carboxylesterase
MMRRPAPDPAVDEAGFVAHGVAFARRIAGSGHPFDAVAHGRLLREELRRGYDPAGTARQLAALAVAGDRRGRLATIAVPTLVIHGDDDPLVPPACGADTAAAIPGAELMRVAGMGHDLPAALDGPIAAAIARTAWRAGADRR